MFYGVVENVFEFLEWILYLCWEDVMCCFGYLVLFYIIDVVDYGVFQYRVWMFLVFMCFKNLIKFNLFKWFY